MRLLVLAPVAVDAAAVRRALPDDDLSDAEVLVVSPALQKSGLRFWMSDADDAIVAAEERGAETAAALKSEGARVRATTGESEPLLALQDALATFSADRILVFQSADHGEDGAYKEEDLAAAREQFGVPVVEATL